MYEFDPVHRSSSNYVLFIPCYSKLLTEGFCHMPHPKQIRLFTACFNVRSLLNPPRTTPLNDSGQGGGGKNNVLLFS